jgi:branched-chain amino acid transport system ATP-binding protein
MRARRAGTLSGGEQQMLCIARSLAGNPRAILLDEPSEGLAPVVVEQVARAILDLRQAGVAVLLAEQSRAFSRRVADRSYTLEKGRIADGPHPQ